MTTPPGPDLSAHGCPPRLLLVDDDPLYLKWLRAVLHPDGYRLECATGGEAALAAVADELPDAILLDVRMPQLDGFGVIRRLKADAWTRDTPVMMMTAFDGVEERLQAVALGAEDLLRKPLDPAELRLRVRALLGRRQHRQVREQAEAALVLVARAVEARDARLRGHAARVARLAARLGQACGLREADLHALRLAGHVHDIGKVAVPESVLLKPGPLDPDELALMRTHPVAGEGLLRPVPAFDGVRLLVRHHHERLDGSGYPDGLRDDSVPLSVRVLSLADAYDALTTARPFRGPLPAREALAVLAQEAAAGAWDAAVLRRLEACVGAEPEPVVAERSLPTVSAGGTAGDGP
jgi:putative two-component system response regulator